jgi:multiple sugar transport system permease protein
MLLIPPDRTDGAGEPKIFLKIILPNSIPLIATIAVLTFKSQWDYLLWPLMVAQSEEMKTIPLYIGTVHRRKVYR